MMMMKSSKDKSSGAALLRSVAASLRLQQFPGLLCARGDRDLLVPDLSGEACLLFLETLDGLPRLDEVVFVALQVLQVSRKRRQASPLRSGTRRSRSPRAQRRPGNCWRRRLAATERRRAAPDDLSLELFIIII